MRRNTKERATGAGGAGRRGRKAKPIQDLAADHWDQVRTADGDSLYFGPNGVVMQRSLERYSRIADQKLNGATNKEERSMYNLAKRRLDVIDICIRLHRCWRKKVSATRGAPEFFKIWETLMSYLAVEECPLTLEVAVIWDTYFEALSAMPTKLQDMIRRPQLAKLRGDLSGGALAGLQKKCLIEACVFQLTEAVSVEDCKKGLIKLLDPLQKLGAADMNDNLRLEITKLLSILCTGDAAILVNEKLSGIRSCIATCSNDGTDLSSLLVKFPAKGNAILKQATSACEQQLANVELATSVSRFTDSLGSKAGEIDALPLAGPMVELASAFKACAPIDLLQSVFTFMEQKIAVETRELFKEQLPEALDKLDQQLVGMCGKVLVPMVAMWGGLVLKLSDGPSDDVADERFQCRKYFSDFLKLSLVEQAGIGEGSCDPATRAVADICLTFLNSFESTIPSILAADAAHSSISVVVVRDLATLLSRFAEMPDDMKPFMSEFQKWCNAVLEPKVVAT